MLAESLHDRAALYVSGAMPAAERENFELVLEFHGELRSHVARLQEVTTAAMMTTLEPGPVLPPDLKRRILAAVEAQPEQPEPEAIVVTNPAGLIEWINLAFTAMCGYTLAELKGRKPGQLLQGAGTDPAAVARIRVALRERGACEEILVNYHKDGSPYRVKITITPMLDDERQPLYFFARERKLPLVA